MNEEGAPCSVLVVVGLGMVLVAAAFWGFVIWAVTQALRSLGVQF